MPAVHSAKRSVLSPTHESSLMWTRRLLLEREGCTVITASNIPEFRACLMSQTFDLILLCQSITGPECASAAQFAREHAPSARLLMMFNRVGNCMPEHADVLLDSLAGPKVFLQTAHRMLAGAAAS